MWTQRAAQSGQFDTLLYDSIGNAGVYDSELSWPPSCSGINQGLLASLSGTNITVTQTATAATAPFAPINSASILAGFITAGSAIVLIASFGAGTYVAGNTTVSDTLGNVWINLVAGNPDFQPDFLQLWYCLGSSGGSDTVTLTYDGTFQIEGVSLTTVEYRGVDGVFTQGAYGAGPSFGTGSPIDLTITTTTPSLLMLATSATMACPGASVTGGGQLSVPGTGVPPSILPIDDKTLPTYSLNWPMSDCDDKNPCLKRYPLI